MTEVKFYESIEDELLRFAVIISKTQNKYVFCKHKDRDTWKIPGGHREQFSDGKRENIVDTAKRELYEEIGALEFDIKPVCVYSVTKPDNFDGEESFGMLFFADIQCFETELHNEIEKIAIMDEFSQKWLWENSFFRNVVSRLASLVYYPFLRKL
ncbi:MAG: NUDIX domain-containing protein [Butyrivibrio sp.]|nr:NUDIX domain-containing protein [Butyrivibrio sp.]